MCTGRRLLLRKKMLRKELKNNAYVRPHEARRHRFRSMRSSTQGFPVVMGIREVTLYPYNDVHLALPVILLCRRYTYTQLGVGASYRPRRGILFFSSACVPGFEMLLCYVLFSDLLV